MRKPGPWEWGHTQKILQFISESQGSWLLLKRLFQPLKDVANVIQEVHPKMAAKVGSAVLRIQKHKEHKSKWVMESSSTISKQWGQPILIYEAMRDIIACICQKWSLSQDIGHARAIRWLQSTTKSSLEQHWNHPKRNIYVAGSKLNEKPLQLRSLSLNM